MQKQSPFKKWMGLISLGYMGGTIYLLTYVRYCFYEQMIEALQCTNAQLSFLNTAFSVVSLPLSFIGAYLTDKLDAKKIIVFSIAGMTVVTFIFAMFSTSYTAAVIIFIAQAFITTAYWASLVKYINNLGGEGESGNSFSTYYLINGLSGALGNALPLWVYQKSGTFSSVLLTYGVLTTIATLLVIFFLDDEKKLAERGVYLKGDEPINVKHIPYVLKWPGTWIIFFAYLCTYTVYSNVSYFNPYLVDVIGIDPNASSAVSVIRSYGAMLVAPLGGIMADKVFKSTSTWYIVAFSIIAVMWIIPLFFGANSNVTLVTIYSVMPSLVIFALYAVTFSILRELHIPTMISGTAIGIGSNSFILVDGVWPLMFGSWIDKFGNQAYTFIFIFLALMSVCGILVALWAKRLDKQCKAGRTLDLSKLETE
ncbi:MAG: MFS transporter [Firmicutes bacterium]|nr:MFS transporter [Bacillota bacterium]